MSYVVGAKGQVVIDKRIRESLGVGPGWRALQVLVDDRVEIRFVPPEHSRSLGGSLAEHLRRRAPDAAALERARSGAWKEEAARRMEQAGGGNFRDGDA